MEKENLYTIIIESENVPGVLYRISGIFLRKKVNVEKLTVSEIKKGISEFTIIVNSTPSSIERIVNLIKKIFEVQSAKIVDTSFQRISDIVSKMDISPIKKVEYMARSLNGVISLAQGIPSFHTPSYIKESAKEAIDKNLVDKYTSGYGILELRNAIAAKIKIQNKINTTPDQIIVTHGAIEGLMAVFMTLFNPTDNLIILSPDYASHITQARLTTNGKEPIYVPLVETKKGWKLDAEKLEAAIMPNTKAILFCNPCNPTGKVYSEKELKEIARIALSHDLYIITDEMYEDFVFENKTHISIGSFEEVADRVISVFGFSKSYAMTGWRIGYITASKSLIPQIFKIHDSLITCPTAVSQYGALAALQHNKNSVYEYKKAFEKRKQLVISELKKTDKLEYIIPEGGYYIFPKLKIPVNDEEFTIELVKKAKVAVVPGSAFGKGGENHIRICFANSDELLQEGLKRLVNYINKKY